jgi:uncharacterized protein (DUF2267 family)
VNHDEMVAAVAERAGVSRRHADDIILATLTALGERLTADETKDLLAQLPKKYKQHVKAVSSPNAMSADEFVARVAQLEGARAPAFAQARGHVRAVFVTLTEAVNAGELGDVLEQLSADFAALLEFPEREPAAEPRAEGVVQTIEAAREQVDEVFAMADDGGTSVGERERPRMLHGAVAMAVGAVSGGITSVVQQTRERALGLVVLAVDGLEAMTDRIDDAAEALQERVHEMVDAGR